MTALNASLLAQLTAPQPRIPQLERWLLHDVWSEAAFESAGRSPKDYLLAGEREVNERESLLGATAPSIYKELVSPEGPERTIGAFLAATAQAAAVVFDGCSLRELPRLESLARASRRAVITRGCSRSAVPSETTQFVVDRLGLGLPEVAPSQLASRRELRERNVRYYYFGQAAAYHTIEDGPEAIVAWCRFPDQRYLDSTAVDEGLFDGIWDGFEVAWRNTVQALPPNRTVLVTSDHGYVFLKSGFSDARLKNADRFLAGKRFRFFSAEEALPPPLAGVAIDEARRLAILVGRAHNRPQAPSAWQSVYRHGGISLMEVLTPWLVLGPVGSA
ncbi:MAG: hypothetical protein ACT4P4_11260 [Betaproteobacteria bacterium]